MNRRWTVRGPFLLAVLAGIMSGVIAGPLVGPAAPAQAHAQLVGTTPANGARLDSAPAEVVLRFSERILLVRDGIRLLDSKGAARAAGPARVDPTGREAILPVPAGLETGVYIVSWRVVSADSHPIHGAFTFGVGDTTVTPLPDAGASASSDPGLSAAFWGVRWTGYAGLALLLGGALFLFVCWPDGFRRRRARRLLLGGWVASALSALGALAIQGPYATGGTLRSVADPALLSATWGTDFGRFVATRLQLLALAGVLLVLLARRAHRPRWTIWAAALLGAALPATWIGTGHANAETNPLAWLADAVHLAAMAAWFGGLAFLVAAMLPRTAARSTAEIAVAVTRFSRLATVCVGLLVVTGTYQAWRGVGSLEALAGSSYGRLLVYKLAAVGVLLWVGWLSRTLVHRHYASALSTSDTVPSADAPIPSADAPVPAPAPASVPALAGAVRPQLTARHQPSASSRSASSRSASSRSGSSRSRSSNPARSSGSSRSPGSSRSARKSERAGLQREQLARKQLHRTVWTEVAIGVAVLAVTSLLVATPPGARPAAATSQTSTGTTALPSAATKPEIVATQLSLTGGGRVYVQLEPARAGNATLVLAVLDSSSKPWDVPEVNAALTLPSQGLGPLPVTLKEMRPGDYASEGLVIPIAGVWQLQIKVRTSEIDQITVDTQIAVY